MTEAMSPEHREILKAVSTVDAKVDRVTDELEVHISETHIDLLHRQEIEGMFEHFVGRVEKWMADAAVERTATREAVEELATVVLGEKHRNFDGAIVRQGGLINDSGFQFKLPWPQLWTLVGTIFMATATVVAAIIVGQ